MISASGTIKAYNVLSPKFADISDGYAYTLVIANQTGADVTTGTFTVQGADALPNDPCTPDDTTWAALPMLPECEPVTGNEPDAKITVTAQNPIKAGTQCHLAVPCPKQFIRIFSQGATALGLLAVVTRLRRTGM